MAKQPEGVRLSLAEKLSVNMLQEQMADLQGKFVAARKQLDEVLMGILDARKLPRNATLVPVDAENGIYRIQLPTPVVDQVPTPEESKAVDSDAKQPPPVARLEDQLPAEAK